MSNSNIYFEPLKPQDCYHRISPHNIGTLTREQVMRIDKMITNRLLFAALRLVFSCDTNNKQYIGVSSLVAIATLESLGI